MARRKVKKQAGDEDSSRSLDATGMQARLQEALPEAGQSALIHQECQFQTAIDPKHNNPLGMASTSGTGGDDARAAKVCALTSGAHPSNISGENNTKLGSKYLVNLRCSKKLEKQLPGSAFLSCKRVDGILVPDKLSQLPKEQVLRNGSSSINASEIEVLEDQVVADKKAAQWNRLHGGQPVNMVPGNSVGQSVNIVPGTSVGQPVNKVPSDSVGQLLNMVRDISARQSESYLEGGSEVQIRKAVKKYEVQRLLSKQVESKIDGPDGDQAIAGKKAREWNRSHSVKPLSTALETRAGQSGLCLAGGQSGTHIKKPCQKYEREVRKPFSDELHKSDKPGEPSVAGQVDGVPQQKIVRRKRIDRKASKDEPPLTPIHTAAGSLMIAFSARWGKEDTRKTDQKRREAKAKELAKEAARLSKRGDTTLVVSDWRQEISKRGNAKDDGKLVQLRKWEISSASSEGEE